MSSTKPLFPASYVANRGSWRPPISAIGSWKSDMIELDPELLRFAVQPNAGYNPITGKDDGVILVDDRDFVLTNSGEFVESRMNAKDIIERGEILTLRSGKLSSVSVMDTAVEKTDRFVSEGLVIYKSVGVSPTDLILSDAILKYSMRMTAEVVIALDIVELIFSIKSCSLYVNIQAVPLLSAGAKMASLDSFQRNQIRQRLKEVYSTNRLLSTLWVLDILEELWAIHDTGMTHITWLGLMLSKNWRLRVGSILAAIFEL